MVSNTQFRQAQQYADLGLSVFPLPRRSKVPAKGFRWTEFQNRRADRTELAKLFESDEQNIAIVTGAVSGNFVVRDYDDEGAYARWQQDHADVARTLPTVRTARGHHVYARAQVDGTKFYSDGELRAGGVYVLAPPSKHPSGALYSWEVPLGNEIPNVNLSEIGWQSCNTEDTSHSVLSVLSVSSVLQGPIEQALLRTIPPGPGQRERRLFELARMLKAIPELANISVKELKPVIQEWHRRSLPFIRTKPFTETWFAFARAWPKVKFAAGDDPINQAYAKALVSETPPGCDYDVEGVVNLLKLCRELQSTAAEKPFFLDCRNAGRLLGVNHTTAWRWLRGLTADGVIELVSQGSQASHKANEYRFLMAGQ